MAPEEEASQDPGGEVFDLRDDIDEQFSLSVQETLFLVESRSGDMLTQAPLWELYQNTQRLLQADERDELAPEDLPSQPYLYKAFDLDTNRPIVGVTTIADAVQRVLAGDPRLDTSLESATDDQVKLAVHHLLADPETSGLADLLSTKARTERRAVGGTEIDYWTSEALIFVVLADNEKLGGGSLSIGVGGGDTVLDKEEFNRNVQRFLRGDQGSYRLWGVAIDLNLESSDEGGTAGMSIMLTVIAAVLIVGISLRSYWAMALTGVGLGILMIWLKGISNLIGIKGGLVIELIVPIAMISLGVDFAVHALRRYQEETHAGYPARRALRTGLAGMLGALVLAMFSDSIAFLSNVSSGIQAVIHFGIAAAIAVGGSFIMLGVIVPLGMMRIDRLRGSRDGPTSVAVRIGKLAGGVGVAAASGVGVILMVAVSPVAGLAVLGASFGGFLLAPVLVLGRRAARGEGPVEDDDSEARYPRHAGAGRVSVEALVVGLARRSPVVLLAAAVVTVGSLVFALRLEPTFDPRDFFDNGSDFVVGLDKLDEHVGERGGEPGIVYVEGDLTDPQALAAIRDFFKNLSRNRYVGRGADGAASTGTTVLDLLARITGNGYARDQVTLVTGVEITDSDGDAIPDSREQVKAAYDYIVQNGVPADANALVFDPGQVKEVLFHNPSGFNPNATTLEVGIPGTREQSTVAAARVALNADMDVLSDAPSISRVGLTGSPFTREAQLDATTKTLQRSLPIAGLGAFLLLLVAMRSVRYAVVTIIPIGLVVAWLYALMHLMGFSLNFVTATIGAVSVGVGIDYSIHMTERFREELRSASDRISALRLAARGTGVALVASAASSIVGFAIMGLAPMPLFASYGMLTAIMIFLALAASLAVLPSLLLLVTRERRGEAATTAAAAD